MSDAKLRERQRAWETNPGDQDALAAYIAALRGAGEIVPLKLLRRRLFSSRTLEAPEGWTFSVKRDGDWSELTPTSGEIQVPEHEALQVSIRPTPETAALEIRRVSACGISRLEIDCEDLESEDLSELRSCLNLEALTLSDCEGITSTALRPLADLPLFHELTLEDQLENLEAVDLPRSLLSLSACELSEDEELWAVTQGAPDLAELEIGGHQLSPQGFRSLREFRELESLTIEGTGGIRNLSFVGWSQPNLRSLNHCQLGSFTQQSLISLATNLPGLEELWLADHFDDLSPLAALPLRELSLGPSLGITLRSARVEDLRALPASLQVLDLSSSFDDRALQEIPRLEELRDLSLHLSSDIASPLGAAPIAELRKLRRLQLRSIPRGCDLSWLSKLDGLTTLDLDGVSDAQAECLSALTDLKSLKLAAALGDPLTSSGLSSLADLPALEDLTLFQVKLDSATGFPPGFARLESLTFIGREVAEDVLRTVASLPALRELRIHLARTLRLDLLSGSSSLRLLWIDRDAAEQTTLDKLKVARPDLEIRFGSGEEDDWADDEDEEDEDEDWDEDDDWDEE